MNLLFADHCLLDQRASVLSFVIDAEHCLPKTEHAALNDFRFCKLVGVDVLSLPFEIYHRPPADQAAVEEIVDQLSDAEQIDQATDQAGKSSLNHMMPPGF